MSGKNWKKTKKFQKPKRCKQLLQHLTHRTPRQKIFLTSILDIIKFILSDKHLDGAGQTLRHFLDKFRKWHFHSTSNEVIWPKNFSNSMHGSKSAILAIFQTGPEWPCTVSAALKNPSQDFKNYFCFGCR